MIIYKLYVKIHRKTGLKYLGQTKKEDPYSYPGSGIYWTRHLAKYGKEYDTIVIKECFSKKELTEWGKYYSNLWNVVKSSEWANLKPETGDGSSGMKHSEETRRKISESNRGRVVKESTKEKIRKANSLKTRTEKEKLHLREVRKKQIMPARTEEFKQFISALFKNVSYEERYGLVRSLEIKEKLSKANKGKKLSDEVKKKISEGNKGKSVSKETCEKLSRAKKGKVSNMFGRVHSIETKQKMSLSHTGKTISQKTKDKLSLIKKGKPWSEARRLAQEKRKNRES